MDCDKTKKFYVKYCDSGLTQNENYNITYPVAKEIRTHNCFTSMKLLVQYCGLKDVKQSNSNYDEK